MQLWKFSEHFIKFKYCFEALVIAAAFVQYSDVLVLCVVIFNHVVHYYIKLYTKSRTSALFIHKFCLHCQATKW